MVFSIPWFIYYLIKNKWLLNIDIFKVIYTNENKKIYFYNTKNTFLAHLPLFYHILKNELNLIGIAVSKYEKIDLKDKNKVGLCTLWFIRKNTKMPNISIEQCNKEYLKNKSICSDYKILINSIISLLYYKKSFFYSEKISIFDIEFDNLTKNEILKNMKISIEKKVKTVVSFVNADCLNKSVQDIKYKNPLKKADYILPDGSGVNIACNMLNSPLKQNLNGTDLFPYICDLCQNKAYKVYLFGAKPNIACKMKESLLKKYPTLKIVGCHHGYVDPKNMSTLIKKINQTNADILLVALGAPTQELFIQKYKNQLNTTLLLGVGGLFDFYSNNIKRAPLFIREIGFEWVYRMLQEPKRMWKRYIIGNPLFIFRVYKYKKSLHENIFIQNFFDTYENNIIQGKHKKLFWHFQLHCSHFFKRILDVFVSLIMLIILFPIFCIVAIFIKIESKGNALFCQTRVGLNGSIFKMYKFRSMRMDAELLQKKLHKKNESKDGVTFKIKDDPRITKIGKFIRKTSIDELPQLYNVLIGEMSLVGPRPPIPSEVALYSIEERKRLDMKPGITCIWQVSGRSTIPFKQQVLMDKKYIKEHGFLYDIILLLKTIPAVLSSKGSY